LAGPVKVATSPAFKPALASASAATSLWSCAHKDDGKPAPQVAVSVAFGEPWYITPRSK
jgi:hypothetical protein